MCETAFDQTGPIQHELKLGVTADGRLGTPENESAFGNTIGRDRCLIWPQARPHPLISLRTTFVAILFSSLVLLQGSARAQGTFQGDTQACSVDQPCFNAAYQQGNTVVFQFTGTGPWDFYNVRFAQEGGGEKQQENRSGHYTFTNVKPNSVYTISVQGCNAHTLARSTCTAWSQASVTTAPEKIGSVSTPVKQAPPSPRPPADPVKSIGRVNVGPPAPPEYSYTGWPPICNSALSARRRNSPAAPTLEAQCRAAGGDPSRPPVDPPGAVGRVNEGPLTPSQLELEDKGSLIVSADPLLTAMRDLEPAGPRRDGFEIGVAIAVDQTLWGPGKQALIDGLPESGKNSAERSANFVVTRNANAKFASDGVSIAEQETRAEVIAARSAEPAGYYTLGFDIGAGIFASAVRGGSGHTLPGPGSASVRNSLPPPGVRGFDAATTLYKGK